jgi:hypothetical protein
MCSGRQYPCGLQGIYYFVILSETKNLDFKAKQTSGFFAALRMTVENRGF